MAKKKTAPKTCAACGAWLVRTGARPPIYECIACAPLRPSEHLRVTAETFDNFAVHMAATLARPPSFYPRPAWCYVDSHLIAASLVAKWALQPADAAWYMYQVAGLLAWRATKAIYRLHPSLLAELLDTPVDGPIPTEALLRLPVWCPYVELDLPYSYGCDGAPSRLFGVFAYLDFTPLEVPTVPLLRLLLDVGHGEPTDFTDGYTPPICVTLALEPGLTVDEAFQRSDELVAQHFANMHQSAPAEFPEEITNGELPAEFRALVRQCLAVLLYLCADNIEVSTRPAPVPCRVLQGGRTRLYEPPAPTLVRCGMHIGEQLRRAREEYVRRETPRGTVAPHVRAAHWHHFWRGPREGPRELVLRWLAPIFVLLDDEPPAAMTVRAVE